MKYEFKATDENGQEYFLSLESYMTLNESGQEKMCPCELRDKLKIFSGITDKNGEKIYDGDRLFNGYVFAHVKYDDRHAAFIVEYPHHYQGWDYLVDALRNGFYIG